MNKPIFKVVDSKGRITLPRHLREQHGIDAGDIVSLTEESGKIAVKKAIVLEDKGNPVRAQRSGSCRERRSSGTSEHSCLRGCEGCRACDDAAEVLEQAVQLMKKYAPPF